MTPIPSPAARQLHNLQTTMTAAILAKETSVEFEGKVLPEVIEQIRIAFAESIQNAEEAIRLEASDNDRTIVRWD